VGTVLGTIGCVIQINISDVSFKEAQAGRSPTRTRKPLTLRPLAILLTHDGGSRKQPRGILGNQYKLRDIVRALSDTEAIAFIRKEIQERD
jgi:hypothetical protein